MPTQDILDEIMRKPSLSQAQVDSMSVGVPILVIWGGEDEPHVYYVGRDHYGTTCALMFPDEPLGDKRQLIGVGSKRWQKRVWYYPEEEMMSEPTECELRHWLQSARVILENMKAAQTVEEESLSLWRKDCPLYAILEFNQPWREQAFLKLNNIIANLEDQLQERIAENAKGEQEETMRDTERQEPQ